jgi:hypothetical protein
MSTARQTVIVRAPTTVISSAIHTKNNRHSGAVGLLMQFRWVGRIDSFLTIDKWHGPSAIVHPSDTIENAFSRRFGHQRTHSDRVHPFRVSGISKR